MNSSSIIVFGIFSALLLILSCVTLNAAKFYNEVEMSKDIHFVAQPKLILRDRN